MGPHLAAQNHCFSYTNPYILGFLMGVDLSFKPPCREIAGPHLAAQNHCFSHANPYILALLMGVDLPDAMIKDSQWMSVALLCKPFV